MNRNFLIAALLSLISGSAAFAQCTKDTDCKGERVCEKGICVAPVITLLPTTRAESATTAEVTQATSAYPKFEDFPATKHPGPWVLPKGVRRVSANEWRNENGKLIEPVKVNFAGKYAIILNSCGTGCRYYTLTDLSTGRGLNTLSVFAAAEPPPTTKEGFTYITDLVGQAGSNMLVAQYQVETRTAGTECRERVFVFENEKLKPLTNTKKGCSSA
jgi:hypothetical protein